MGAVEKEVAIPTNNDVLEAGQDGGVGILTGHPPKQVYV
jgi:hypothetical protein